jgi:hypothetical protein
VRGDHGPRGGRGDECGAAKRRRRFGRNWIGASASACGGVLPAAVVGRPGWRRSRRKGRQSYTLCVGMPDVFVQCICMSRRSSTCEQENPKFCEGVGIANQFGPIGFSHKFMTSSSSYSSPIVRARPQHLEEAPGPPSEPLRSLYAGTSLPWPSQPPSPRVTVRNIPSAILHPLQSPSKLLRHPLNLSSPISPSFPYRNLVTIEHFSSPILFTAGIHFPPVLLHNQSYPKVCSDPLNLPNAGDPFAGTSSLSSYPLFSPTRDLIASIYKVLGGSLQNFQNLLYFK